MRAIEHLLEEHRIQRSAFQRTLEALYPLQVETLLQALDFFKHLVDRAHHAKEEDVLFPALMDGTSGAMKEAIAHMHSAHTTSRGLLRDVQRMLAQPKPDAKTVRAKIERYIAESIHHMDQEERTLFPIVQRSLPESMDQELLQGFEAVQARLVSAKSYQRCLNFAQGIHVHLDDQAVGSRPGAFAPTVASSEAQTELIQATPKTGPEC